MHLRSLLVPLVSVAVAASPFTSFAQTTPESTTNQPAAGKATDEASVRYKRGTELFEEENYVGALIEFRKAYELTHEYKVLYNIGVLCQQLQDYVCALDSYETYLKAGGGDLPQKRKDEVTNSISTMKSRIGAITIVTNEPGVDITVDDVARGKTPLAAPILLSIGHHVLVAEKPGKTTVRRALDVAGREQTTLNLELVDLVAGRDNTPSTTPSRFTTLSWVGIAGAGALAIGAGVTGVLALSKSNSLKDKQYVGDPSADAVSTQSSVKTLRLTSDILTGAAVVTLGVTLFFTLTRKPSEQTASLPLVNVAVTPGGAAAVVGGAF